MSIQAIKGVKDVLPEDITAWHHLEATARKLFEDYGYAEIRIPIFEYTELFARSIGASTDIVEKEMYTFEDRDGKKITLRPEGTAGVVRAFVEHKLYADSQLTKLYYLGPMFRHERPQKGRYRQFYQIGVEALGMDHPHVDVEILVMLHALFTRLGISDLSLLINSLGDSACRGGYRDALKKYLYPKLPTLCTDCQRRYETNPLRVLDCKVDADKFGDSPVMLDYLCDACKAHFQAVEAGLTMTGVPFRVDQRLVRGLDYYTRTTFELVMGHMGAQNTVAAGGRYDGLAQEIGGPSIPAIGFAIGVERLVMLLPEEKNYSRYSDVFLAALGEEAQRRGFALAQELRDAGIWVELDYEGKSLKSQMRKADRMKTLLVMILGEEELKKNRVVLRDMATKNQEEVPIEEIVGRVKSKKGFNPLQ